MDEYRGANFKLVTCHYQYGAIACMSVISGSSPHHHTHKHINTHNCPFCEVCLCLMGSNQTGYNKDWPGQRAIINYLTSRWYLWRPERLAFALRMPVSLHDNGIHPAGHKLITVCTTQAHALIEQTGRLPFTRDASHHQVSCTYVITTFVHVHHPLSFDFRLCSLLFF